MQTALLCANCSAPMQTFAFPINLDQRSRWTYDLNTKASDLTSLKANSYAYPHRVVDIDMEEQGTIEAGAAQLRIDDAPA